MATVEVDFFKYPKVKYSTKRPPLDKGTKTQCFLKEETSVLNPVLQIRGASQTFGGSEFPDFNLAYIADFHRYYFVRNITSVSALIWEVTLEVDPLATYKDEILSARAFLQYGATNFNPYIADTRLPITTERMIPYFGNLEWTENVFSSIGIYMLTTINRESNGSNGLATTYACTAGQLEAISQSLNESGFEEITRFFTRPMDAFISCIWMPLSITVAGKSPVEVKFGEFSTGVIAASAKESLTRSTMVTFQMPYSAGDFRNVEPYTEFRITLPGVGMVQIPLSTAWGGGANLALKISYTIDVLTGAIVYRIATVNDATFLICDGKIGVPLPISANTFNVGGLMSSTAAAIGGAVTVGVTAATGGSAGILAGGVVSATTGIVGSVASSNQSISTVSGSLGSRAGVEINNGAMFYSFVTHKLSTEPTSVSQVIGRPIFKMGTISSCGAFVQCTGAQVESVASSEEADAINNYLKGGVLIE